MGSRPRYGHDPVGRIFECFSNPNRKNLSQGPPFLAKNPPKKLARFFEIHQEIYDHLRSLPPENFPLQNWNKSLKKFLQKYLEETHTALSLPEESSTTFWEDYKKELFNEWEKVPQRIKLTGKGKEDHSQPKTSFLEQCLGFLKSPLKRGSYPIQDIAFRLFLKSNLELPLSWHLFQEWEHFENKIADQWTQLHQSSERVLDDLLFLEVFHEKKLTPDPDWVEEKREHLKKQMALFNDFSEKLAIMEKEAVQRFKDSFSHAAQKLNQNWGKIGTLLFSSQRLSEEKILERWAQLERDFNKSKNAWLVRFQGKREDWQKDLELSLLQTEVAQVSLETLEALNEKCLHQVLPPLEELREMVTFSMEKFQKSLAKNEEGLQSMILSENRMMLRSLRREKLPSVIQAVEDSQIGKTLENFLSRTKYAVDQLPERHILLQERNGKGRRISPKTIEIPLKELVVGESFSHLTSKHENPILQIQPILNQIVKDIQETGQIIKYNLEAALDLLQEEEKLGIQGDAQTVAVEGLERTTKHIGDLINRTHDIFKICKENLFEMALHFEKHIQNLADNEKIIDLKFRLAKTKTSGKFRIYYQKTGNQFQSSISLFFQTLTQGLTTLRTYYFHLKKFTGLEDANLSVEETLSHFIARREKQISKLPHVYRRLFQIEPLQDERFFEERPEEFEQLKKEFSLWEEGQPRTSVLVSERGSGRTSIIYFAR